MLMAPVIFSIIASSDQTLNFANMTLANQVQTVNMIFIIMTFFWIAGLPLVLSISVTCGDFISKEENDGTLLLLVSKPVRRYEIITGKFLAFIVDILILETVAIIFTPLIMYWLLPIDPYVLDTMVGLIPSLILYSLFVALTFGAIAIALSSISKSRFKTIMILVAIAIAVFFGFMVFRGYMNAAGIYDPYGAWVDVNYHMGNSYMFFLDSTGYRMTPPLQAVLGSFTGTYSAVDPSMLYDQDIGAMYPSLTRTDYVSPLASLFGWSLFTVLLLVLGILRFQKREIP